MPIKDKRVNKEHQVLMQIKGKKVTQVQQHLKDKKVNKEHQVLMPKKDKKERQVNLSLQ